MQLSDDLRCLFSATIEQRDGSYVIEVPDRELETENIREGDVYRIAVVGAETAQPEESTTREASTTRDTQQDRRAQDPPVEEGDIREVEIEDVGEQGDGLARVGPGYVVFVPETRVGDTVTIELTDVRETFAFGEVTDRE